MRCGADVSAAESRVPGWRACRGRIDDLQVGVTFCPLVNFDLSACVRQICYNNDSSLTSCASALARPWLHCFWLYSYERSALVELCCCAGPTQLIPAHKSSKRGIYVRLLGEEPFASRAFPADKLIQSKRYKATFRLFVSSLLWPASFRDVLREGSRIRRAL